MRINRREFIGMAVASAVPDMPDISDPASQILSAQEGAEAALSDKELEQLKPAYVQAAVSVLLNPEVSVSVRREALSHLFGLARHALQGDHAYYLGMEQSGGFDILAGNASQFATDNTLRAIWKKIADVHDVSHEIRNGILARLMHALIAQKEAEDNAHV